MQKSYIKYTQESANAGAFWEGKMCIRDRHKLTSKEVILADGTISEKIDFIGKMTVKKARAYIIELLKKQNLLVKQETIHHMVAVHELSLIHI